MPVFVDLLKQVKKTLRLENGGTGNISGWATGVVVQCTNNTGAVMLRGTVVRYAHTWDDARVVACETEEDVRVLGVVVGTYKNSGGADFEDTDPADGELAAVMTRGTCDVRIDAAVTRGQFAYVHATDGKAKSISGTALTGAFGVFQQSQSSGLARVSLAVPISEKGFSGFGGVDVVLDGAGAVLATGIKCDIEMKYAGVIIGWTLVADQSGSVVIDLWKDTYANYPPVVGDSITASAKPTITTATKGQSFTLTGWTTAVAKGDIIRVNVDSVTTIQRVTLGLLIQR